MLPTPGETENLLLPPANDQEPPTSAAPQPADTVRLNWSDANGEFPSLTATLCVTQSVLVLAPDNGQHHGVRSAGRVGVRRIDA